LVCDVSPSSAAEIIGTPKNSTSAAAQIAACSVTIDPENANAFPDVKLSAAPGAGSPPVSAQVELDLHDALGAADDTRVIVVGVAKSDVPLASYPVNGNYVGLGCHIRTITFADGTVQNVQIGGGGSAGSSSGATLGILGGLLLVGGIAAAAGHGGSSSPSQPQPAATATLPVTHPPSPTPKPSPTPLPTATPTATPAPTASPVPTPTASPTAGALVITPQSLTFIATGASYAKTTQASEANYPGAFMASPSSCIDSNGTGTTVASIGPASTTSGLFTVTPLGAGACTFSITDSLGDLQTLSIGVTTTGGTVMAHKKKAEAQPRPTPSPSPSPSPSPNPRPAENRGGPPPHRL
jgi:hypothetical protein